MSNSKKIISFLVIIIIILNLSACTNKSVEPEKKEISNETKNLVQNYIKENISQLSPESEVLGGKFYITNIKFEYPDIINVNYEDGHIALQAQANFEIINNQVNIINFELINNDEPLITNEYLKCNNHEDCIPVPGCHSRECINKRYKDNYEQPEACTLMYDNCAAYEDNDCICQQGTCFNENLMNPECN